MAAVTRYADSIPTRRLIAFARLRAVPLVVLALLKCDVMRSQEVMSFCVTAQIRGFRGPRSDSNVPCG